MKESVSGLCQLRDVTQTTGVIAIIGSAWAGQKRNEH